ncbi:MAG: UDP-glucuronosyltransferase, partial [Proteobacteria bacterium]|nr:UDP-glucuronosyltransferase [Pseudomonadota bacterium]
MSRYLFAWELGANYGHLARDLPVAERLRAAGHAVSFAVSDTRTAAELLTPRRLPFVQAPLALRPARLANPPVNYAELLLAENWGDRTSLLGRVKAWQTLIALIRPSMIVADHAPTALLAARCCGTPSIAMGSGFEIPPLVSPLPSI